MAWNEPGGSKDPWGRNNGRKNGQVPDIEELLNSLQKKVSSIFGGGGKSSGDGAAFGMILVVIVGLWAASGFYTVDDAERGVVLRLGAYTETTMPGLHWHLPWPIESVEKVNVSEIAKFSYQTLMLTRDENIVTIDLTVQYRRTEPTEFLFEVRQPEVTLEDVTESAIREVVGTNTMDFVLGEGRAEIARQTKELVQHSLDAYGAGMEITSVNLQDANFPNPVQPAVRDAIKAREDRERLELEAQTYANDVVPRARGEAARRLEAAEAYRQEVIANAEGQTARFTQLLAEYRKAPGVTRERLFLETMEEVLGKAPKVLVSTGSGGNLMMLPLDELLKNIAQSGSSSELDKSRPTNSSMQEQDMREREAARSRGVR